MWGAGGAWTPHGPQARLSSSHLAPDAEDSRSPGGRAHLARRLTPSSWPAEVFSSAQPPSCARHCSTSLQPP